MNASQIIDLLATKHAKDVFVPECKNGPTWGSRHSRLDAWAMARSWTHPKFTAYEVKVSRTDFVNDDKWTEYLPLCHELYFVCPSGLIAVEECHEGCGLIHVSKTGTRLFVKRRAPRRQIDPPVDLLIYALMRSEGFSTSLREDRGRTAEYWRRWMATCDANKSLGHSVSQKIQRLVRERIDSAQLENRNLRGSIATYESVKAALSRAGISEDAWDAGGKLVATINGVPDDEFQSLDRAKTALVNLVDRWQRLRTGEDVLKGQCDGNEED